VNSGTCTESYACISLKTSITVPNAVSSSVWLFFPLFSLYQGTISVNNVHFEIDLLFSVRS